MSYTQVIGNLLLDCFWWRVCVSFCLERAEELHVIILGRRKSQSHSKKKHNKKLESSCYMQCLGWVGNSCCK
uniref:Uncharacterized protein n=1 Tax=Arundo donax TaxID=35708 RepID=A0A0A8XRZ8_ARUDO